MAVITKYHKLGGVKQLKCILSIREARSSKSRWQQDLFLLEAPRENPFPISLLAFGGCRESLPLLGLHRPNPLPPSPHYALLCVTHFLFLTKTFLLDSEPTVIQDGSPSLPSLHLQITYLQIRSHSEFPRGHEFWRALFNPL